MSSKGRPAIRARLSSAGEDMGGRCDDEGLGWECGLEFPNPENRTHRQRKQTQTQARRRRGKKNNFIPSISVCLLSSFWLVGPVDDQRHRNLEPSVWPVLCRVPPQCTTTTFVEGRSFCRYCRCQDLTSFHHQISLAGPGGRGARPADWFSRRHGRYREHSACPAGCGRARPPAAQRFSRLSLRDFALAGKVRI